MKPVSVHLLVVSALAAAIGYAAVGICLAEAGFRYADAGAFKGT